MQVDKVYCGDSFELLKQVPKESVRLALFDPPYQISKENSLEKMGRRSISYPWDNDFDLERAIQLIAETVMPGGSLVCFNSWQLLGDTAKYLANNGLNPRRNLVWIKSNAVPRNMNRTYLQSSEQAVWATKGEKWVFNKRTPGYESGIFKFPTQRSLHPNAKPLQMFREIIRTLSNPRELVLDPFAGSGTTPIAAKVDNRQYLAFELDQKYVDETNRRLDEIPAWEGVN